MKTVYKSSEKDRERARLWYLAHRESELENRRRWRQQHRSRVREQKRRYRERYREKILMRDREYNRRRRQQDGDYLREYSRRWRAQHREYLREYNRSWNSRHSEAIRGIVRRWRKNNPDSCRAQNHRRRAKLRAAPGSFTANDIRVLLKKQNGKCFWCGEDMKGKHTIDHFVPLGKGSNDPSNLVLACRPCNSRKYTKMPNEFIAYLRSIGIKPMRKAVQLAAAGNQD